MTDIVIAIPTLNEAATIASLLDHFLTDAPEAAIVVIDGGSTDGTCDLVRRQASRVTLLHNPARLQAAALNLAADWATAQGARLLIRADAHATYPQGYVQGLCRLLATGCADSVVVPLVARPGGSGRRAANALLQRHWLGHGGSRHRRTGQGGPVDHGHHAAFRLDVFRARGGYDADFAAAEDVEFDHRLRAAGGRIHLAADLPVSYLPRDTAMGCFRQMLRNGYWRARVWQKHGLRPGARQVAPTIAGAGWLPALAASTIWPPLASPALLYLGLVLLLSAHAARSAPRHAPAVAVLALMSHTGFALGVLRAALGPRRRASPAPVPA